MSRSSVTVLAFVLAVFAHAVAAADEEFIVVHTGEANGFLEPCGCDADLLGGIARRDTALAALRRLNPNVLLLSNGDISAAYGEQDEIKLGYILRAMTMMGYDLVHLGDRDLAWDGDRFMSAIRQAGLSMFGGTDKLAFDRRSVGSIPVLIAGWRPSVQGEDLLARKPGSPLERLHEEAARSSVGTFRILMFQGAMDDAIRIAETGPPFHLIVSGHAQEDAAPPRTVGKVLVVNYGSKGKYLGAVKVRRKTDTDFDLKPWLVKLDKKVASASRMMALLAEYDAVLKDQDLVLKFSNRLPLSPGQRYQGSAKCAQCHAEAFDAWTRSSHHHAYETLAAADKTHDPECIACHTVGYGQVSGFSVSGKRPDLRGVGCENCHGPGYPHRKQPEKYPMKARANVCLESCHVPDHSPKFDFEVYWKRIQH